jgi:hypothetical protein
MQNGLAELINRLRITRPDQGDVAVLMKGKTYAENALAGEAAKNYLRLAIDEFLSCTERDASLIKAFPETDYCKSYDTGHQIRVVSKATRRDLVAYDAAVMISGRPAIIDIRTGTWNNINKKYFTDQHWERTVPLEDFYGKDNFDRILVLPEDQAPQQIQGVHLVKLPFSRDDFFQWAGSMANIYSLKVKETVFEE